MAIDLAQFKATFFVEASEHLAQMESALLLLENSPEDDELLNTIFRAAHSIKGASTTFGLDDIGQFTHVLESLLDRVREGSFALTSQLIELLLASVDVLQGLLVSSKEGSPVPGNVGHVLAQLQAVEQSLDSASQGRNGNDRVEASSGSAAVGGRGSADGTGETLRRYQVRFCPSLDFFRFGQDPLLLLQELSELGRVDALEADIRRLPPFAQLDPESCYVDWTIALETSQSEQAVRDVFMFLDAESRFEVASMQATDAGGQPATPGVGSDSTRVDLQHDAQRGPASEEAPPTTAKGNEDVPAERRVSGERRKGAGVQPENETVRVDRHRLDELINHIGELVIGASMVEQEVMSAGNSGASAAMLQLAKIVRDLQEMSLSLRMVPIAATFQKMNRLVRDLAKKLGKQINLQMEGEETELDKSVVDQIGDPLVHMVRNAVDHAIETSEVRRGLGKPEAGRIILRAYQQGGNIFIDVEDDGRGLDRESIWKKAIERGLVDSSQNLTDAEVCNLIFLPGFSTAQSITDVSGRGVGMDVVRRNVESLQGNVTIKSTQGRGSIITIRLPLTLAILDGLLIRLRQEVYVIPLLSVVESIRVAASQIRLIPSVGEVVLLRGEVVPVVRLRQALQQDENGASDAHGLLVIVEDQGRRFAMMVDDLIGQQQVVIKNLETNLHKVPGVAGATILGDGRVALILDICGVASLSQRTGQVGQGTLAERSLREEASPEVSLVGETNL